MSSKYRTNPVNIRSREVRDAVQRARHRAQVLIFAVQQLFAVNIILVYGSSAQLQLNSLLYSPEGLFFLAYLTFSFWCVYRSSKRRLRWIDVVISIVLDFVLLMEVMFIQHESAGEAADISATPLFSYVFLFIAMRCMHYQVFYVYLAGALAGLSWFLLLQVGNPGNAFNVSDALLLGVVDKVISIVMVTAVLGVCVYEARRHLYKAAIRGAAGKGLARMVGNAVAKEVLFSHEALVPGRGRQQVVAILMMDISNFTKLAFKNDPSDVLALLAQYQQRMEPIIVKYGGCIDKFMGDGILAHFGALAPDRQFVASALACVEHLLHETDRWNSKRINSGYAPLEFRVACAVGQAVVGLVGGATKMELTIIGDPVNITAKLEKHAKQLSARAVTTVHAYNLGRQQGYTPKYPTRIVEGVSIDGTGKQMDLVVLGERPPSAVKGTNENHPITSTDAGPTGSRQKAAL